MTSNFIIKSYTEIEFNGRHIDLHNNFSFVPASFQQSNNIIKFHFNKSEGTWVPKNELNKLSFTFTDVNFLKTIPPGSGYIDDDYCLANITYYDSEDREENYWLTDKPEPSENDDIIFTFESDRVIRINCSKVELRAE